MKLEIKVGEHQVEIEVTPIACGDIHVLELTARCGETTRHGRQTISPKHDHTVELLQEDIRQSAQRLAEEAAGHEQTRKLKAQLFPEA
jgi:hypothetical protein